MELNTGTGDLFCSENIWSRLEKRYDLRDDKISTLIKTIIEQNLNMNNVKPHYTYIPCQL